jgi:aminoglycoside phosphotransferase (APT) family kinase protein
MKMIENLTFRELLSSKVNYQFGNLNIRKINSGIQNEIYLLEDIESGKKLILRHRGPYSKGKLSIHQESKLHNFLIKNGIKVPNTFGTLVFDNIEFGVYEFISSCLKKSIDANSIYGYMDKLYSLQPKEIHSILGGYSIENSRMHFIQITANEFKKFLHHEFKILKTINKPPSKKIVLRHGDLHKKNFIVSQNNELYAIDWEFASVGPVEFDLSWLKIYNFWLSLQDTRKNNCFDLLNTSCSNFNISEELIYYYHALNASHVICCMFWGARSLKVKTDDPHKQKIFSNKDKIIEHMREIFQRSIKKLN